MNQHQPDTLFLVYLLGVIRPSSGGSAQMLFGLITYIGCMLTASRLRWNYNLHVVIVVVTPETCRGNDS
jgi:hypothetical protein